MSAVPNEKIAALARLARICWRRDASNAATAETGTRRGVRLPLVAAEDEVIQARDVDEDLEFQVGGVAQRPADLEQIRGFHVVRQLVFQRGRTLHATRQMHLDLRGQGLDLCSKRFDVLHARRTTLLNEQSCSCARSSFATG
jgi:hypothetical protein